jgi:hypothetical protein
MFPRSFWFVEIQGATGLGMDRTRPYVKTDPRAIETAKDNYRDVLLEGNVEAEFLYQTLLSTDLVPFGNLPFRTVVLPIMWKEDHYVMLKAQEARSEGYLGLAEWLENCEAIWGEKRGEKAERESIYDWLDYRKKLSEQSHKRYSVVYPDVNRVMFGAVLKTPKEGTVAKAQIVESALYYFHTDNSSEANYLASWLNSSPLDETLQSFRRKSQGAQPHVHKKVWEMPIPLYDSRDSYHQKLAELGKECGEIAPNYLDSLPVRVRAGSLGRLRNMVREKLRPQLDEIDEIVRSILKC